MKRSKHSLSHYKLATMEMGGLYPVSCFEVLPGDSVQMSTSAMIRVQPMVAPVMHPVSVRIHHWYVPHRLVWDQFENFITGGRDGLGDGASYPLITAGGGGFAARGLLDYLGVKPGVANLVVSALPVRSYNLIYQEFYRDQDLINPIAVPTGGGADTTSPLVIQKAAWEKDYFTSARPWSQKGPSVTLPLGTTAPVSIVGGLGVNVPGKIRLAVDDTVTTVTAGLQSNAVGGNFQSVSGSTNVFYDPNGTLRADLSAATAVDVNTVRRAFALQRYQEARAQYGSRFVEYLRYLGIRSSDARLQRPEYCGGGKQTIAFTEVLQTGVTTSGNELGVGNLRGHGIAAMRSNRFRRFIEEHGLIITLMSVRPRTMYQDGLNRMWLRRSKEDYWQKELEMIGQQSIARREVFAEAGAGGDTIFGYNDRYHDMRHVPSQVSGDFRALSNFWHLGRIFAAAPTLNGSFVECDASTRIYSVAPNDHLYCMVSHSIQARRLVSKSAAVGRII